MTIKELSVEAFLDALASRASTPGGGSAAAILGGMGAALTSMVCHLTIGKKKYAAVEAELIELRDRADALRGRLVAAIQEDVAAFDTVMAAYGLPKETDADRVTRDAAIQHGLVGAMEAPLHCARLAGEVIDLAAIVSEKGSLAMVSDGGVAALAGLAALRSSALNVYVNARTLTDRGVAEAALAELAALLAAGEPKAEATWTMVARKLQ